MNPKIEKALCQTAGFLQDVDFFFKGCRLSFLCIVSFFLILIKLKTDLMNVKMEDGNVKVSFPSVIQCWSTP